MVVLFALCYVFLLRLPSEALPISKVDDGYGGGQQAGLFLDEEDVLVLVLDRRKNKPEGSRLKRECWCRASPSTCPVHALWPLVNECEGGQRPFAGITADFARSRLREILEVLQIEQACLYRTHDLRRGHAEDLVQSGCPLPQILRMGEWTSPSFMDYVNLMELERRAVVQAHVDESSGGESEDD